MNRIALVSRPSDPAPPPGADGTAYRYWAFLSYSHADSKAADKLHRWIERFRTPVALVGNPHPLGAIPARLTPIFRDRHELAAASSLGREIEEALQASRYLIVLCSPAAARSRWVDEEIRRFKRRHGEDRVLAAIVDGEPFTDGEDECLPAALRHKVGKDGKLTRQKVEPIAADLRDDRDGWRTGALKVAAGMLDVGLDDLIQRDQLRRQRKMTLVAAASILGMAFTTGLSVVAINARDEARDERREAESLIGFMLGDLRAELEPIGRISALDKVGARALAFYERQDKKKLTDDQLAQRSKALSLLGQIAMTRDDYVGALARYREAMLGTEELTSRFPDNPERLFEHAQNVFYVADIARSRGNDAEAERNFKKYKELADRMVALSPDDPKYQLEKKYADTALGVLLYESQRYPEATVQFRSTLAVIDRLIGRDRDNLEYLKSRSETLAWLADSRLGERALGDALALRRRQQAEIADVARRAPGDVWADDRMTVALRATARLESSMGDTTRGIATGERAVAIARKLVAAEPQNMVWRKAAAVIQIELGTTMIGAGQAARGAQVLDSGCSAIPSGREDASIVEWREIVWRCRSGQAKLAQAQGDRGSALVKAGEALAAARRFKSGDAVSDRMVIAETQLLVGDILAAGGSRDAAREAYRAGLDGWPAIAAEGPRTMFIHAALLRGIGDSAAARPLEQALRTMGYRRLS